MARSDTATPERPVPDLSWWWVVLGAVVVVVRVLSPGILEAGDGINHHLIARYSWVHPHLFLDHWGKPLYTLFSSPFAQLGHWGGAVFNAVCFVCTCWAADGMLRRFGTATRFLFPPTLIFVPVYSLQVFEGMTEVFFALLAVVALRAAMDQRPLLFAVLVSFLPFARPEYIAVWPFGLLWLLWQRQWRVLPWLLTGHVIYAVVGSLVLGDALWAFHRDPYVGAKDIYGSGPLAHFVVQLPEILGMPLLVAALISFPAFVWCFVRVRSERSQLLTMSLLALVPALAVLAIHTLLWWTGSKGSLGLTRVLATAVPLLALFVVWTLALTIHSMVPRYSTRVIIAALLVLVYPAWALRTLAGVHSIPVMANEQQVFLTAAGKRMAELAKDAPQIHYLHPFLGFAAGIDPYQERVRNHFPDSAMIQATEEGTLFVWDAHFGPNEGGVPLDRLLRDDRLRLLDMMVPAEHMKVLGARPFEVYFFERRASARPGLEHSVLLRARAMQWPATAHRLDTMSCDPPGALCFNPSEFPLEVTSVVTTDEDLLYTDLRVRGSATFRSDADSTVQLIFTENDPTGTINYSVRVLQNGPFDVIYRVPKRATNVANKVYLWNLAAISIRIEGLEISVDRTLREPR